MEQLKDIADMNVRSQILYMTSLNVFPKWKPETQHYILPEDQLPLTINAIEAKLGEFNFQRLFCNTKILEFGFYLSFTPIQIPFNFSYVLHAHNCKDQIERIVFYY